MADKTPGKGEEKQASKNDGTGGRRFRLTDLFADSAIPSLPKGAKGKDAGRSDIQERANALGMTLPPAANQDVIATANRVYDTTPRAKVLRADELPDVVEHISYADSLPSVEELEQSQSNIPTLQDTNTQVGQGSAPNKNEIRSEGLGDRESDAVTSDAATSDAQAQVEDLARRQDSMNGVPTSDLSSVYQEIEQLREGMEEMYRVMIDMQERGDAQDKVFNTLHSELQDYKNDFIYEHLKPVVRPLLFLFDHMEQFDNELASQRNPVEADNGERRLLSPVLVRENIAFFREQLVEALRICEVTPMKHPEGEVDLRLHKVIETVSVSKDQHNTIQRTVRSGWYLNGRVFRQAEVIVGVNKDLAAERPLIASTRLGAR